MTHKEESSIERSLGNARIPGCDDSSRERIGNLRDRMRNWGAEGVRWTDNGRKTAKRRGGKHDSPPLDVTTTKQQTEASVGTSGPAGTYELSHRFKEPIDNVLSFESARGRF